MFKQYILILILAISSFMSYAGTMILEDYPIMYFPDKNGVKLDVVQEIVADAVDRSSYPQHLWTIDSEKPGEIIARLNVRSHVLRMKITFDTHKINLQYHDSTRLSFSENAVGMKKIHSKYKPWSEFLLAKIKYVAKRKTKMSFVDSSPIQVVVTTSTGGIARPKKIVISAFAEVGGFAREKGIYDDATNSALFAKEIVKQLNKKKPANITLSRHGWGTSLQKFNKNHRTKDLNYLCKQENADVLMLAYLEEYLGGSGGLAQRNMFYYSYNCADDDLVKETYELIDDYDEAFPYQLEMVKSLKKFIRRFNILK